MKNKPRQRAPSKRSLETRARILDAAERVFAERGFEGASIRDIAALAGAPVGLVHHHGEGKEELFRQVVARRADELSQLRRHALSERKLAGALDIESILECFFRPYLEKAQDGGSQWLAYARIVAHVSADPRWQDISARHFDPTAQLFIAEIGRLYPDAPRQSVAAGFVFSVAAMLAVLTSRWRIGALSGEGAQSAAIIPEGICRELVRFSAAGIVANLK